MNSNNTSVEPLRAVWSGEFTVFGVRLKCHTLENGERVIEQPSMEEFFSALGKPEAHDPGEIAEYQAWVAGGETA